MTYDDLLEFVLHKMNMSHIYQPLLIRSLVDAGGSATLRQLAHSFLSQDESQLIFYEDRIKHMPMRVLKKHGVITSQGELVSLNTYKLTYEQKAGIRRACEERLQEYISRRGLGIWDYRLLDQNPIPDSLRYRVLADSGGKCSLCGISKSERPLDVDHIKPRSKGGKTEYENLQALCTKCHRSKGNRDDTDFRAEAPQSIPECPFCYENLVGKIEEDFESVIAILDGFPVSEGHHLIIPKRHTQDFFSMSSQERQDAERLIETLRKRLVERDNRVNGFNVGVNCGESAGQTIFHAHIHLIPRRSDDTPNPRGGVRGVVPDKMSY